MFNKLILMTNVSTRRHFHPLFSKFLIVKFKYKIDFVCKASIVNLMASFFFYHIGKKNHKILLNIRCRHITTIVHNRKTISITLFPCCNFHKFLMHS